MQLTNGQIEVYRRDGFLVLENYFSREELDILLAELPGIFAEDSARRVLERSGVVRSVFASHVENPVYRCLSRLERMVRPARQLLGSEVYVHQFKINAKAALDGEQWEWHQDFLYWHKEDRMPTPRSLTAVLFLQEVNDFNGPMLVIPGSHLDGMVDVNVHDKYRAATVPNGNGRAASHAVQPAGAAAQPTTWAATLTADLKYKIDKEILARLISERSIVSVTVPAGSVMFFHSNLFHASSNNLSPWDRYSVFASYNSVENVLGENSNPRPEFIAWRDASPLAAESDDALLNLGVVAK
jgi:ectoine hydroxylase